MKFGGTSVGEASRILAVAEIVRAHLDRQPVVVVSALAGVTDLLAAAGEKARTGDREGIEPILADLERRHRWAIAGAVSGPRERHDLTVEVDGLFEELRQLLRALRTLGESSPRAVDAVLAFGESLSSLVVTAAFVGAGLKAVRLDAREVVVTDDRHGAAQPDLDRMAAGAAEISRVIGRGEVPIVPGFVGATREGRTTTLGRGGSDLTASAVGCVMGAAEIQIWSDVDGILSADPKWVDSARTLSSVTFAEATELAHYGAKVLHPASIAPAVRREIPVRVLNTFNPMGRGTVVRRDAGQGGGTIAAIASRAGVAWARIRSRRLEIDPGFLPRVVGEFRAAAVVPDLVVASELAVTVAARAEAVAEAVEHLRADAEVETAGDRAVIGVVGSGLAIDPQVRRVALEALAELEPELVAVGGSGTSATAVVLESELGSAVRRIHRRFFEEVSV